MAASQKTPSQLPILFNVTPNFLIEEARSSVEKDKRLKDKLVETVSVDSATFATVIVPILQTINHRNVKYRFIDLLGSTSTDLEMRNASITAKQILNSYFRDTQKREDMFLLIDAVLKKKDPLDSECQIILESYHRSLRHNGISIPSGPKRDHFHDLWRRLGENNLNFGRNLRETSTSIWLSEEDLQGVPDDVIQGLERDPSNGELRFTFQKPDIIAVLNHCRVSKTREKVYLGRTHNYAGNVAIFDETILLRDEAARMLGYKNYASQRLQSCMAKSPDNVNEFLADLKKRLQPRARLDLQLLKDIKRADPSRMIDNHDHEDSQKFFLWDKAFYRQHLLQQKHQVDSEKISEYFPADVAIRGMLDIFEHLFGLVIKLLSKADRDSLSSTGNGDDCLWHPDVRMFTVWDDASEGGGFVGYLYTDIHPRPGKFNHAANYSLGQGFIDENGKRHCVSTSLICNVSSPSADKPSLLKHSEVITLFHELGHAMHDLLSRTQYSWTHGYNAAPDFGEAPSQLLEFWCWIPERLKAMSLHYSYLSPEYKAAWIRSNPGQPDQPPEKLPDDLIKNMLEAKYVTQALLDLEQVVYGVFDMKVNGPASREEILGLSVKDTYNTILKEYCMMDGPDNIEDWGHNYAITSHLMGPQDANYYAFLYSKVFSADMFYTAFRDDPMNAAAGRKYRHQVLEKGGSQDEIKTLTEFLGRPPNSKAFEEELRLDAAI